MATELGRLLGWKSLSADRIRKRLAGIPPHHRGSAEERAVLYGGRMSDRTYAELMTQGRRALRRGQGVILDATFGSRSRRNVLRREMQRRGVRVLFLEVRAARTALRSRLARRRRSRTEVSDARLEDLPVLDRNFEPPTELGAAECVAIESGRSIAVTVRMALAQLAERRAATAGVL